MPATNTPRSPRSTAERAATPEPSAPAGFLSLTRRAGESVVLTTPGGETIVVTTVEIRPNHVRLTFAAPRSVEIARTELLVEAENQAALRRIPR